MILLCWCPYAPRAAPRPSRAHHRPAYP
jgi:hypothetical protein